MVKVFLTHRDLMTDPRPSRVIHLVNLRMVDVNSRTMECQLDGKDNKYLDIWYYDNPHWREYSEYLMHKVRIGRFRDHEAWLEIDGKEWKYQEIVDHFSEVQVMLDQNETEERMKELMEGD